jgi:uncharacterized protein YcaQ
MRYRGWLRVARREGGTRCHELRVAHDGARDADAAIDRLVDVIVAKYAPLPAASLGSLVHRLAPAAPQWAARRRAALARSKVRLPQARVDGSDWFWPAGENPASRRHAADDAVCLLAPFDPVVWDRRRFEQLWGWAYRFEAYVPAPGRVRGHYALPLRWRDQVIGWGHLAQRDGRLLAEIGFVAGKATRDAGFRAALDDELGRRGQFLGLGWRLSPPRAPGAAAAMPAAHRVPVQRPSWQDLRAARPARRRPSRPASARRSARWQRRW